MDELKINTKQISAELEHFEQSKEKKVQFSYLGAFDDENMMIINQYIEFAQTLNIKSQRTNLFKIFVELTQNISQNSLLKKIINNKEIGCGKLTIAEYDNHFVIIASNPAKNSDIELVKSRCIEINKKNKDELRQLKRVRMREKTEKTNQGNGNIGLIKIAMIAENNLNIITESINKTKGYLSIAIKLNK